MRVDLNLNLNLNLNLEFTAVGSSGTKIVPSLYRVEEAELNINSHFTLHRHHQTRPFRGYTG